MGTEGADMSVPVDGPEMPALLRRILDRLHVLETASTRMNDLVSNVGNMQEAQTAVQQSLNL